MITCKNLTEIIICIAVIVLVEEGISQHYWLVEKGSDVGIAGDVVASPGFIKHTSVDHTRSQPP